ncbi:MAG: energy-converting hydrogenase B subunit D [Verrucomicrobiales bacterium]|jgi:energy-converting hydrogenase B subunit D
MIEVFNIILLLFLVITALLALHVKDLISATMILGIYSFLMCLLWAEMGAVDVAFTEAAVGAGVSAVFMIATVYNTKRRSKD